MCVNIFLDEMHYDNSEKDLTVGSAIRIINEVVLCYLQPLYCEAINNMQKNSLTMANRNINNHIHDSLPYKLSDEDNLADCVMYGTDNLESPVSINKKLKEIDINIIINSILWALAIKELDNTIKQFGKNEIITDELTEDAEKAKNDDFIKQTIQKNNELQTQVIALKNKNDLLEKANNDLNQRLTIQYKDSIHSMEAQIASQKSEIAELNSIIDNKEHLIIKLQNEIDRLKQTAIPKDDTAEITPDINGRYVFISTDEVMATKLQSWFPNSIARSSYEITPTNAPVIDKVIVMVTKVKHHDYYKIKQDCKNFGVPIVHCNKQSFSEICKVL